MKSAAPSSRRALAVESFKTAGECIGKITPGMSLFAITRGQFSMIDAIRYCLGEVGPSKISVWTWTIAEYEVEVFRGLMGDGRVTGGRLVIDFGARVKNAHLIQAWKASFGAESVRYVVNHAKIATVENDHFKLLLRGSLNLNFNPRFEQFDLTEGGLDFDLVREIEDGLPVLADDCTGKAVFEAAKVNNAFDQARLDLFREVRVWKK